MPNTFFYLHGFNSDADRSSDKVQLLQTIGEVILLSYDSFATYDNILRSLIDSVQVDPHENPVFVGTSLGGFYAAELGKHYGLPSVLINPAWNPYVVLARFVGQTLTNYKNGAVRTLERESTGSYAREGFVLDRRNLPLVLLDEGDELLDSKATREHFMSMRCPVVLFEGGTHRFEHMKEALPHISQHTAIIGRLALRVPRGKPAHHLWNNNGTWWVHYSIRHPEGGTRRYRESLKTPDFETACRKRDKFLRALIRADSSGGIPL